MIRVLLAVTVMGAVGALSAYKHVSAEAHRPRPTPVRPITADVIRSLELPMLVVPSSGVRPAAPVRAGASASALDRRDELDSWTADPVDGVQPVDGFEATEWPSPEVWPLVADLNAPFVTGRSVGYPWESSDCASNEGDRALRAPGRIACDAPYPDRVAASALLALDLSRMSGARSLALTFDVWLDADPDEGLLIQFVRFEPDGRIDERRPVFSATGRSEAWVDDLRLDLTDLRDVTGDAWAIDLRGERAFLEFLFFTTDGAADDARGVAIDDLALDVEMEPPTPTPSFTPTPVPSPATSPTVAPSPSATAFPPTERISLCDSIRDCNVLSIRVWFDRACDGRFQRGSDSPLRDQPQIIADVDGELLGTTLSRSGRATFLYPAGRSASVSVDLQDDPTFCPGVDHPTVVSPDVFNRFGRASLDIRLERSR